MGTPKGFPTIIIMETYKKIQFDIIFTAISTGFVFSLIQYAITIPKFFNKDAALKYDFDSNYKNPDDRQIEYILSQNGIFGIEIIFVIAFLLLGVFLYLIRHNQEDKYKENWNKILAIGFTILGVLVTVFSIWKN